jgi:hypothetical protein
LEPAKDAGRKAAQLRQHGVNVPVAFLAEKAVAGDDD